MPLTATIAPAAQRLAAAAAIGSRVAGVLAGREQLQTRGPHAGQAFGWAWKRRSRRVLVLGAGSAAHIAKPAIVVSGRS